MSKEIFHDSVIITIPFSAHALTNAFLFQHGYVVFVPIVLALIGVQNQMGVTRYHLKGLLQHCDNHR